MPAQAWVTLIVGGLAAIGVIVTWQQKNRADKRSEWWRRATWALERTFSANLTEAEFGWTILTSLVGSRLATKDDSDIVQVIAEHAALDDGGDGEDGENGGGEESVTNIPDERAGDGS